MRRRSLATAALTPVLVGLAVLGPAPVATADTPGCLTKKEWKTAKPGYKMTGIHERFDTKGTQHRYYLDEATMTEEQTRHYERCSGLAQVAVDYERVSGGVWRMTYKWGW